MRTDLHEDIDLLLFRNWRPVWSDFERIRYLRELASGAEARLEHLRKQPFRNGEEIAFEEVLLFSTARELRRLEYKLSIGENQ